MFHLTQEVFGSVQQCLRACRTAGKFKKHLENPQRSWKILKGSIEGKHDRKLSDAIHSSVQIQWSCKLFFTVHKHFYSDHVRSFDPRCWGGQTLLTQLTCVNCLFWREVPFLLLFRVRSRSTKWSQQKQWSVYEWWQARPNSCFLWFSCGLQTNTIGDTAKEQTEVLHRTILRLFMFSQDMDVSWNGGTPSHPFWTRIFHEINFINNHKPPQTIYFGDFWGNSPWLWNPQTQSFRHWTSWNRWWWPSWWLQKPAAAGWTHMPHKWPSPASAAVKHRYQCVDFIWYTSRYI